MNIKFFNWRVRISRHAFGVKKLSVALQGSNNAGKYLVLNIFGTGVFLANYDWIKK